MLINDPNMPNPFLVVSVFAFSLAIVRVFTVTVHEMGHAVFGLLFLKGNMDVYVGSYGDPEKGTHFKIGRIRFHFIYDPFSIEKGVFRSERQEMTNLKNFLMTLGGPLASLITAGIYVYVAIWLPIPEVIKIVFYILTGSSLLDFYYNIKPAPEPVTLDDGTIVYNDGYMLMYIWRDMFGKQKTEEKEEDSGNLIEEEHK